MTDPYMCPACNEKRGCTEGQTGPKKMQILKLRCSSCGYKYVWADQKARNVLDAYREAVEWAYGKEMAKVI